MTERKSRPPILDEPISPPSVLDEDFNTRFLSDVHKKWDALFAYYGIGRTDPNAWMDMAFELANEYVPGFSVERAKRKPNPKNPDERRGRHHDEWDARILPLAAFTVLCRRKSKNSNNKIANIVGREGNGLMPITGRRIRKIMVSKEFEEFSNLMSNVANDLGDQGLDQTHLSGPI